jgi:AcrR family transcriptional regulator
MPKAFSEQEKRYIRERLLEQGSKQFSRHGLKKTSVEELASSAGISKAAFYLFFASKEALFLEVAERFEGQFRQGILAAIELPGKGPRARLLHVFKTAFASFKNMPLLQVFSNGDYEQLFQHLPLDQFQNHLQNDQGFMEQLIDGCRRAGIPIQVQSGEMIQVLYPLALVALREDNLAPNLMAAGLDVLLELAAGYCLGEITLDQLRLSVEGGDV